MSKQCCENHDDMFADGMECGLAGMGKPIVCCDHCPMYIYFTEKRKMTPLLYMDDFTEDERNE